VGWKRKPGGSNGWSAIAGFPSSPAVQAPIIFPVLPGRQIVMRKLFRTPDAAQKWIHCRRMISYKACLSARCNHAKKFYSGHKLLKTFDISLLASTGSRITIGGAAG